MGHVHTKTMKKVDQIIIEKYYSLLGSNFHCNKHMCKKIAVIPSQIQDSRLCHTSDGTNSKRPYESYLHQAAGRGERKRDESVPEVSALDQEVTEVDPDIKKMLKLLDFGSLSNLQVTWPTVGMNFKTLQGAI